MLGGIMAAATPGEGTVSGAGYSVKYKIEHDKASDTFNVTIAGHLYNVGGIKGQKNLDVIEGLVKAFLSNKKVADELQNPKSHSYQIYTAPGKTAKAQGEGTIVGIGSKFKETFKLDPKLINKISTLFNLKVAQPAARNLRPPPPSSGALTFVPTSAASKHSGSASKTDLPSSGGLVLPASSPPSSPTAATPPPLGPTPAPTHVSPPLTSPKKDALVPSPLPASVSTSASPPLPSGPTPVPTHVSSPPTSLKKDDLVSPLPASVPISASTTTTSLHTPTKADDKADDKLLNTGSPPPSPSPILPSTKASSARTPKHFTFNISHTSPSPTPSHVVSPSPMPSPAPSSPEATVKEKADETPTPQPKTPIAVVTHPGSPATPLSSSTLPPLDLTVQSQPVFVISPTSESYTPKTQRSDDDGSTASSPRSSVDSLHISPTSVSSSKKNEASAKSPQRFTFDVSSSESDAEGLTPLGSTASPKSQAQEIQGQRDEKHKATGEDASIHSKADTLVSAPVSPKAVMAAADEPTKDDFDSQVSHTQKLIDNISKDTFPAEAAFLAYEKLQVLRASILPEDHSGGGIDSTKEKQIARLEEEIVEALENTSNTYPAASSKARFDMGISLMQSKFNLQESDLLEQFYTINQTLIEGTRFKENWNEMLKENPTFAKMWDELQEQAKEMEGVVKSMYPDLPSPRGSSLSTDSEPDMKAKERTPPLPSEPAKKISDEDASSDAGSTASKASFESTTSKSPPVIESFVKAKEKESMAKSPFLTAASVKADAAVPPLTTPVTPPTPIPPPLSSSTPPSPLPPLSTSTPLPSAAPPPPTPSLKAAVEDASVKAAKQKLQESIKAQIASLENTENDKASPPTQSAYLVWKNLQKLNEKERKEVEASFKDAVATRRLLDWTDRGFNTQLYSRLTSDQPSIVAKALIDANPQLLKSELSRLLMKASIGHLWDADQQKRDLAKAKLIHAEIQRLLKENPVFATKWQAMIKGDDTLQQMWKNLGA